VPGNESKIGEWRRRRALDHVERKRRRWLRWTLIAAVAVVLSVPAVVVGSNLWLGAAARDHLYTVADAPAAPVALVLGAQVYPDGTPSPPASTWPGGSTSGVRSARCWSPATTVNGRTTSRAR
jgi:hypothetical protein